MTEEEYLCFIQPYEDALKNIRVRVDVLNNDYRRKKTRITPSIISSTELSKRKALKTSWIRMDMRPARIRPETI